MYQIMLSIMSSIKSRYPPEEESKERGGWLQCFNDESLVKKMEDSEEKRRLWIERHEGGETL